ncbi:MAG: flagellar hook-associated protein FlgK [bacterium]|nr:flagellar hook-associated protein FlgK [bacterium]
MANFSSGVSAIRAATIALETVGQNIANADNPNYKRQDVRLEARPGIDQYGHLLGTGVDVASIVQAQNSAIEAALTANLSSLASADARAEIASRVESLLAPSSGSLAEQTRDFFQSVDNLAVDPGNAAIRREVVSRAQSLIETANEFQNGIEQIAADIKAEIQQAVGEFNNLAKALADVQNDIAVAEGQGLVPNDMYDRRTQLVNEIAELVDVRTDHQGHGEVLLFASGAGLIGQSPAEIQVIENDDGELVITQGDPNRPLPVGDGKIAGLIDAYNEITPNIQNEVGAYVDSLVREIDKLHAQGLGLNGSFTQLKGVRGVIDTTVPLDQSGASFPIEAGNLFVSITDTSTGARTIGGISIDPATESLDDIAAKLSAIDHLQAVVDTQTGTLQLFAEPGYAFDFAPQLPTEYDLTGVTGNTEPALSGRYTGPENDAYTFAFTGSGTVGVTDGLQVEVRNVAGDLVSTLDVGLGYQSGEPLNVGYGVSVSFTADTANAGDTFTTALISNSDSGGALAALGLNSFFQGDATNGYAVSDRIQANPDLLAASFTSASGDNTNAQRLADLKDLSIEAFSGKTFEHYLADVVAGAGQQSRDYSQIRENVSLLNERLTNDRAAVSGVDPNEELVKMIQFQRSFQAAARYISAIDETLVDLMNILG